MVKYRTADTNVMAAVKTSWLWESEPVFIWLGFWLASWNRAFKEAFESYDLDCASLQWLCTIRDDLDCASSQWLCRRVYNPSSACKRTCDGLVFSDGHVAEALHSYNKESQLPEKRPLLAVPATWPCACPEGLRDPITLLPWPDYEGLLLCLLRHRPALAASRPWGD